MDRQLTVDFNRVIGGDLIRANSRRATPGTVLEIGSVVVVGDDDWGVRVPAADSARDRQICAWRPVVSRVVSPVRPSLGLG